jgi:hypothetical protein
MKNKWSGSQWSQYSECTRLVQAEQTNLMGTIEKVVSTINLQIYLRCRHWSRPALLLNIVVVPSTAQAPVHVDRASPR